MPVRTVYIDVDQTLINIDDELLPRVMESLEKLHNHSYQLVCWSGGGQEHARNVCERHEIEHYFDYFLDKPDIVIDDEPDTIINRANKVQISTDKGWVDVFDQIYKKKVY